MLQMNTKLMGVKIMDQNINIKRAAAEKALQEIKMNITIEDLNLDLLNSYRRRKVAELNTYIEEHRSAIPDPDKYLNESLIKINAPLNVIQDYLKARKAVQEAEKNEDNIANTDIKKPRGRGTYETDSDYVDYLRNYYESIISSKLKKDDEYTKLDTEIKELDKKISELNSQFDNLKIDRDNLALLKKKLLFSLDDQEIKKLKKEITAKKEELEFQEETIFDAINQAKLAKKNKEAEKAKLQANEANKSKIPSNNKSTQNVDLPSTDVKVPTKAQPPKDLPAVIVPNQIVIPKNVQVVVKKSKIRWKTVAWVAAGLTAGVVVGLTVGPGGILVANVIAGAAKGGLRYAAEKARTKELTLPQEVKSVEEPSSKLQATLGKFKKYLKSEEGLKDVSAGLTGFMVGTAIGKFVSIEKVANSAKHVVETSNVPKQSAAPAHVTQSTTTAPTHVTQPTTAAPAHVTSTPATPKSTTGIGDIKIGNTVKGYNVTSGHDTASWAVNNSHSEHLINQYVNASSKFKSFAIPDGKGGWSIINDKGLSIADVCEKYGVKASDIAVDIGRGTDNASQAWTSVSDLMQTVGGKGL